MRSKTSKKNEISLPTSVVSERIQIERLKRGYKQDYMATKLGITERAYQNIESNANKNISLERIQEIASILEMDWLELLVTKDKITQIHNGDNSPNSNNIYQNDEKLTNEIEKLKLHLQIVEKENAGLKKEIDGLKRENQHLQEIISLLKER